MLGKKSKYSIVSSKPPFWKDDKGTQLYPFNLSRYIVSCIISGGVIIMLGIFIANSENSIPFIAWGCLLYFVIMYGTAILWGLNRGNKMKKDAEEIKSIQKQALEKTGAILIGSAIHVAGDPMLDRDQNIVLALTTSSLVIFSYDSDIPVETIFLSQIIANHTVVYDDEHIPHREIVDSTAQSLQLSVKYGDNEYDLLFRNMRKVRPIDWYHAIQKARFLDITQNS